MTDLHENVRVAKKINIDSYTRGPDMRHGPGPELMGASTLIGDRVRDKKDEELGEIKEIMLDMRTGEVSYAVLSYGGFLGMGDKLFAVPWDALTLDAKNEGFMLDVGKKNVSKMRLVSTRANGPTCRIHPGQSRSIPIMESARARIHRRYKTSAASIVDGSSPEHSSTGRSKFEFPRASDTSIAYLQTLTQTPARA